MPQSSDIGRFRSTTTVTCALMIVCLAIHSLRADDVRQTGGPKKSDGRQQADDLNASNEPKLLKAMPPELRLPRNARVQHRKDEVQSDHRVEVVQRGTSSRSSRKAAIQALPLENLTPENRAKAEKMAKSFSIYRELPTLVFEVDPSVYQFFLNHPDVAVSIWRVMGISKFQMWQTGPLEFEADADDGTVGFIDVLYRSSNESLLICDGEYQSPFIARPIKAKSMMHLKTEFYQDVEGKKYAKHSLKLFVDFPSVTVEAAAKILSPLSNLIVDRNFHEVSMFLHMMSLAMERRPDWVEHIAGQMDGVLKPRKKELVDLSTQVYETARKRTATAPYAVPRTSGHAKGKSRSQTTVPSTGTTPRRLAARKNSKSVR